MLSEFVRLKYKEYKDYSMQYAIEYGIFLKNTHSDNMPVSLALELNRKWNKNQGLQYENNLNSFLRLYTEELERNGDYQSIYIDDIREAAQKDELLLLELLLFASNKISVQTDDKTDLFLLDYLIDYFKNKKDKDVPKAKIIFEYILDISENGLTEYTKMIDQIFSLDVPGTWFDDFGQQVMKLLGKANISEETFLAVKKGLTITPTYIDMHENILDYIRLVYLKRGLVDEQFNWI